MDFFFLFPGVGRLIYNEVYRQLPPTLSCDLCFPCFQSHTLLICLFNTKNNPTDLGNEVVDIKLLYLNVKWKILKLVVTLEILGVGLDHFYWVLVTLEHLCFINITESTSGEVS